MITRLIIIVLSFFMLSMQVKVLQTKTTTNFRIMYEKNIPADNIKWIAEILESKYSHYRTKFGISLNNRVDVYIFSTVGHFRIESQSRIYDDGDSKLGKLYLVYSPKTNRDEALERVIARLMAKVLLTQMQGCPEWLAESYSIYAGHDLSRFGEPARLNISNFTDLAEEYNHQASNRKDLKELYAKLAATIQFFLNHYGENKVDIMLKKFKTRGTIDEIFESSFNEKIADIEKEWAKTLRSPQKQ